MTLRCSSCLLDLEVKDYTDDQSDNDDRECTKCLNITLQFTNEQQYRKENTLMIYENNKWRKVFFIIKHPITGLNETQKSTIKEIVIINETTGTFLLGKPKVVESVELFKYDTLHNKLFEQQQLNDSKIIKLETEQHKLFVNQSNLI